MRKNAEKALKAFDAGQACRGETISTDGDNLYSYSMLIAKRFGKTVDIIAYEKAPSATTRSHIRATEVWFKDRINERF